MGSNGRNDAKPREDGADGESAVIRQAISCDICATEKKQNNNWFVASEQGGELRLSGWNSRNRLRPGMKHLCGQTCLHKLVDEFMARTIPVRVQQGVQEESVHGRPAAATDSSLTAVAAYEHPAAACEHPVYAEGESSARLIAPPTSPVPVLPRRPALRPAPELVPMPGRHAAEEPVLLDDSSRFASRNWRAEAWDRERERELRSVERRSDINPRRRAGS
jgi:hypothetical protein